MPPNTNTRQNVQSDQLTQLVDRLNSSTNVLVTVSENPSVDQLAACIGLTIALNKQGKHATAVFSGKVPSTLEFLKPEQTIETNTNSLRDFIISLDKSKADKLRYKVEDDYVKIFITPYRTSISDEDLNFSQGDFNIDLIITIGVHERKQLDGAIVAHGRILHDATIASINSDTVSELGSINWVDSGASSLCEMVSELVVQVGRELIDAQIATALLTGMVAETDRFGNDKVRPRTMEISGVLVGAGASPQLISNKLKEPEPEPEPEPKEPADEIPEVVDGEDAEESEEEQTDDGSIQIDHSKDPEEKSSKEEEEPKDDIHIDEEGKLQALKDLKAAREELEAEASKLDAETASESKSESGEDQKSLVLDPPQLGGRLTANDLPEHQQYDPSTDPMSVKSDAPLLDRAKTPKTTQLEGDQNQADETSDSELKTLEDIERSVNSAHLNVPTSTDDSTTSDDSTSDDGKDDDSTDEPVASVPPPPPVDDARAAVEQAADSTDDYRPQPINALGATPIDLDLEKLGQTDSTDSTANESDKKDSGAEAATQSGSGNTPPPVPPPLMPPGV